MLKAVRLEGRESPFNLERDLVRLEQAIASTGVVLVIISPLSAYLGRKDSYKDSEIRGILDPLAALAEKYRIAIVAILHLTKAQQRKLLLRAQGSIAFVAIARTVLVVGESPDHPGCRLLASLKNNFGPPAPALAFRISDRGLAWEPVPVEGTADQLLAGDEVATRTEQRERDEGKTFLRDVLSNGPVASKQVYADAKANGISPRTLERAKRDLGVRSERVRTVDGNTGPWYWHLQVLS